MSLLMLKRKIGLFAVLVLLFIAIMSISSSKSDQPISSNSIKLPEAISTSPIPKLTNEMSNFESLKPIDSMVNRVMRSMRLAGASVAVVKDERLVYAKGFGFADKDAKEEVEPYHLFRIGSVSKLITAMTILKLVDEGELSLDNYVFGARGILNGKTYSESRIETFIKSR